MLQVGPALRSRTRVDMQSRWQRALERALADALDVLIEPVSGEAFVESASRPGVLYAVSATGCTCSAGRNGQICKHRACYLAQIGELALPDDEAPATVQCPGCLGSGYLYYRSGYSEPCGTCQGSGVQPDARLQGEPATRPVAAAA
jgi:hypothetical protein